VKDDLLAPNPKRQDPHPELRVDTIELEIGVAVTKEQGGKISIRVLEYGEQVSTETTQRVRVALRPIRREDQDKGGGGGGRTFGRLKGFVYDKMP